MSQYKSLLGLSEIAVDSLDIANLDLTNTNIIGLNTDRVPEDADPVNLYFTNNRFDARLATKSTTDLKERLNYYWTDNRFDTRLATKSTTDLKEGLNYYWTDNRFDTRLALKSTTDLKEGTNLYYTDGRFDTRFSTKSTTNLAEGTNLYYTTARANTDFDARLLLKTTADLKEGTNLYYTTARANTDFDARLTTKSTTNLAEGTNLYYTNARFDTQLATKSTTNLAERTNLYYTTARFDTQLATKSTTNLAEGTNLYYTTARANTDFDTRLATKSTTNLAEGTNLYYTTARANTDFDTRLGTKSTTNLAEGTNLYYTTARANTDFDTRLGTKSIDALSDVIITTPANGQLLSYNGTNWVNATGSITYLALSGGTMSGGLNMGGQSITNVNLVDGIDVSVLDTSVVKLTGDQSIAGNKKFTSTLEVSGSSNPASFDGIGIAFDTKIGAIIAQKTATATYYPIQITGSYVDLYAGNTLIATATGTTLSLNNNKITNLATPSATTDGANKSYVDTKDGQNVKLTGNQTIAGIKTFSSGLEITGNSTNATTKGTFVVFNSTANIGTIGCLDMGTGVNYNFEINAKKISFIIDGAIVGWVNASGLDCNSSKIANLGTPTLSTDGANKSYVDTLDGQNVKITGNQTIAGTKTFNNQISMGTNLIPTLADHVANKKYVDDNCVKLTGDQTIAGTKTFSNAIIGNDKITTSIGKPIIIGKATKGVGATGGLEIYGTMGDAAGAHFQTITTEDAYPTFQLFNWAHNDINLSFDAYFDGANFKSSSATSNFLIQKGTKLGFYYKSGVTAGSNITWSEAMNISTAGLLTTNAGISTTTLATSDKITTALSKPIIIGNTTKGVGTTGGLELYGTASSIAGAHLQAITTQDIYPTFQLWNWTHDNIIIAFDAYHDGTNWKSSHSGSNFLINKNGNKLAFNYKSGVTAGSNITWSEAMNISTAGLLTANAGISTTTATASGVITANAGISSAQSITMTNSGSQLYFSDGTTTTCGIRWQDDNHGVFCQRNANQMFIKEYGDIHFQTTGSTWRAQINSGGLYVPSAGASTSVQIGMSRSGFPNEPMILLRSGNNANNRGFIGHSGSQLYAWNTSNSNGEPSGGYNYAAVGGAWAFSSDRRLKADIKTLECGDCCEKLMQLNCCSYYWKTDEKKEKKNCGFIADEVKKIFPEFVETTSMKIGEYENLEGITYTDFIPILVSAFQHMAEKVINLEKENKNLMNILQDQANQLAEIRAVVFSNDQ